MTERNADASKTLIEQCKKRGIRLKLKKARPIKQPELIKEDIIWGFFSPEVKSMYLSEEERESLLKGAKR